eukprot:gene6301-10307_t
MEISSLTIKADWMTLDFFALNPKIINKNINVMSFNSNTIDIQTINSGKKTTRECKFRTNETNSISVSIRQKKLQTDTEFDNTLLMELTNRSPGCLHFDLTNYKETKLLFVKVEMYLKEKSESAEEVKHEWKSYINIKEKSKDGKEMTDDFELQTTKEHDFNVQWKTSNKANNKSLFKMKVKFSQNLVQQEPDYIFVSPFFSVHSRIDNKKRKLEFEDNYKQNAIISIGKIDSLDDLEEIRVKLNERETDLKVDFNSQEDDSDIEESFEK